VLGISLAAPVSWLVRGAWAGASGSLTSVDRGADAHQEKVNVHTFNAQKNIDGPCC